MDGRHGQLRAGVEGASALASVARTNQIELAGGETCLMSLSASASIRLWYGLSDSLALLAH